MKEAEAEAWLARQEHWWPGFIRGRRRGCVRKQHVNFKGRVGA